METTGLEKSSYQYQEEQKYERRSEGKTSDGKMDSQKMDNPLEQRADRKGRLYALRGQHFIELLGCLKLNNAHVLRTVVFGIFMVENWIYLTCLNIKGGPQSATLHQKDLLAFFQFQQALSKEQKTEACHILKSDLVYSMRCTSKYLDLFRPSHWAAVLWYVQYLLLCESKTMVLH